MARNNRLETQRPRDEVSLAQAYLRAKKNILASSYREELVRLRRDPSTVSESEFLEEVAWVILSAGISEVVVSRVFPRVSTAFLEWRSARCICQKAEQCIARALRHFRHQGKVRAIARLAQTISAAPSFEDVKRRILRDPIRELQAFDYVGPVTAFHVAKNIGIRVAKPDRHLVRLACSNGFESVHEFCGSIACFLGEDVRLVDSVLWRFATMHRDYVARFSGFVT